ncbi:flagellar filament capping protein FliD [Desulfosporosinus youngiae]|uniref:Flagellar hook-associated protein 2 n=1 Tax=Desulfosporosinus youngiae DSM 17734 TaxID=768710 RepID=H5XYR9_9FIRM|nr:flagellar filament capping protein FliD [Desulfosporosinus youngiae]EHQ91625.1 flagellar capping protein [Desulfosporosinus youngiae DSM 17734]
MAVQGLGGIYGLSGSGMDIDSLVKQLMQAQQIKSDALFQKKTVAEWQKTAYNTVYDEISKFRDMVFNYKLQANLNPKKVTASNSLVATATANSSAANVSHSLVVAQLADGVKLTSTASLSTAGTAVDRTTIASQFYAGTAVEDIPKMVITIANGPAQATLTVDPTGSINDFVSQINKAGLNITANYDATLDRIFLTTNNSGAAADISFAGSNTAGMTFLTDKLKLPVSVLAGGSSLSSSGSIHSTVQVDFNKPLATQFKGLTDSTLRLANSATGTTQDIIIKITDTLQDVISKIFESGNAEAWFDPTTGQFGINPTQNGTLSIEDSDQSAKDLFSQLNMPATFNVGKVTTSRSSVYIPLDNAAVLKSQFAELESADSFTLNIANGADSPTAVVIDPANDTLESMLAKIRAVPGVDASYDETTGKVTLKSANGENLNFAGSDAAGTSFLANTLKLHQAGLDAVFKLDGVPLSQSENTFNISGVTYNLTAVSQDAEMLSPGVMNPNVGQATNITVANDIEKAVDGMQALVDAYNKIMESLNNKVKETRYKDFPPLTEAQKKELKETEITAWETKAKSGMLHNDSTLTSLLNAMRNAFNSVVSGVSGDYNIAAAIGITTGPDYTEGGKLYLNTDKLRKALETEPDVLTQLFGASGATNPDGTIDSKSQGIAGRLYDVIKITMDQLNEIAGTTSKAQYDTESNYAKKISDYAKQISTQEHRFESMQTAYYKQFNAMEVALQQLSAQSGWLATFGNNS